MNDEFIPIISVEPKYPPIDMKLEVEVRTLDWVLPDDWDKHRWDDVHTTVLQWIAGQLLSYIPTIGAMLFLYYQTGRFPVKRDIKTTLFGALAAILTAITPIIETGKISLLSLATAAAIATLAYFTSDKEKEGDKK